MDGDKLKMEITELLDGFELPSAGLGDLNPQVDFNTMIDMFGDYCRKNHIKTLDFIGQSNPNIRLTAKNFGKIVRLEVNHLNMGLTQRMTKDYNSVAGYYQIRDKEGYEIFFRASQINGDFAGD
jgi:hypothetical protein